MRVANKSSSAAAASFIFNACSLENLKPSIFTSSLVPSKRLHEGKTLVWCSECHSISVIEFQYINKINNIKRCKAAGFFCSITIKAATHQECDDNVLLQFALWKKKMTIKCSNLSQSPAKYSSSWFNLNNHTNQHYPRVSPNEPQSISFPICAGVKTGSDLEITCWWGSRVRGSGSKGRAERVQREKVVVGQSVRWEVQRMQIIKKERYIY